MKKTKITMVMFLAIGTVNLFIGDRDIWRHYRSGFICHVIMVGAFYLAFCCYMLYRQEKDVR